MNKRTNQRAKYKSRVIDGTNLQNGSQKEWMEKRMKERGNKRTNNETVTAISSGKSKRLFPALELILIITVILTTRTSKVAYLDELFFQFTYFFTVTFKQRSIIEYLRGGIETTL